MHRAVRIEERTQTSSLTPQRCRQQQQKCKPKDGSEHWSCRTRRNPEDVTGPV